MNWVLLKNSLMVGALATAVALIMGLVVAVWLLTLGRRARAVALGCAVAGFALPAFLVTGIWLDLLGNAGRLRDWVPFDVYSLPGCAWILGLMHWPVAAAAAWLAWRRIEAAQLEVDPMLRGAALLRDLLLPIAAPALRIAAALMLVLTLGNFAVPSILQVKTYPAEIWLRFNTANDVQGAFVVGWPLLLAPAVLLLALRHRQFRLPHVAGGAAAALFRGRLGGGLSWTVGGVALAVMALSMVLPVTLLLASARTWSDFGGAWSANRANAAHSFLLAATAASAVVALGGWLWRRRMVGASWFAFFVPGALLSAALIPIFNRPGLDWIYRGVGIALIALTFRYLAIGWAGARMVMGSIDPGGAEFATMCGASRWERFRHGVWPQAGGAILGVWYAAFLLCLWDVDAVLLVAPPGMQTLPMQVFNLLHYGHNSQVNALCLILLLLGLAPLLVWLTMRTLIGRTGLAQTAVMVGVSGVGLVLTGCGGGPVAGESGGVGAVVSLDSKFFEGVKLVGERGIGPGQFNKPRSLAVDAEDNLYVVDMTGRVQKFSEDGEFLLQWQMPEMERGRPKGMYTDGEGNVIVVEPHYARINHHGPDGTLVAQWGMRGEEPGQLAFPRAVTRNSRGELYLSEFQIVERVQRFSAAGAELQLCFGKAGSGPGEFNRAEGLGIDSEDRLYVADSCNHRIQVFLPDGKFLRTYGHAGSGSGEFSYPYDIRVDGAGIQYVCEFGNSRLQIFDAADHSIEIIGGAGAELGQFANPWSIAFDSKGNLYVADSANHRVQKLLRRGGTWGEARVQVGRAGGQKASSSKLQISRKSQISNLNLAAVESGCSSEAGRAFAGLALGTWNLEFPRWRGAR